MIKGSHHTEAHKKRISKLMKGRVRSEEHRKNLSTALTGKTIPVEVREKIRKTLTGRKLPESHRRNMAISQQGVKSHLYKDGLSHLRKSERNRMMQTIDYKLWREAVFKRDKYQCVIGGKKHSNRLEADHIKKWADYPELRFKVSNGRTLCKECHKKTDTYGR